VRLEQQTNPLPHVELKVLDRGLGVPNGSEEKIFEQFYRAHDSLSSGIQGSGLGLTLARQIARAHGGEVVYEPREGGGSCFTLRLPLCPACDKKSA
jgi:signal transduction histidine kinase